MFRHRVDWAAGDHHGDCLAVGLSPTDMQAMKGWYHIVLHISATQGTWAPESRGLTLGQQPPHSRSLPLSVTLAGTAQPPGLWPLPQCPQKTAI